MRLLSDLVDGEPRDCAAVEDGVVELSWRMREHSDPTIEDAYAIHVGSVSGQFI